jgi:hypothetical protein
MKINNMRANFALPAAAAKPRFPFQVLAAPASYRGGLLWAFQYNRFRAAHCKAISVTKNTVSPDRGELIMVLDNYG